MQIAIVGAKFTPGEADKLRRAMATFRNSGKIHEFRERFIDGMIANKYSRDFAERCFRQIEGFGDYGFPESHAASFAILVCASAWVKCYHPDVFLCAILNAQPMGFYAPAQLIRDARDHGVQVRPVDVNASHWDCVLEKDPDNPKGLYSVRLGFRIIGGISETTAAWIVAGREKPYTSPLELWRRSGIPTSQLMRLAETDVFLGLGWGRRDAVWAVKALNNAPLPLFSAADRAEGFIQMELKEEPVVLTALTMGGEVAEDYVNLSFSLRAHPLSFLRNRLTRERWLSLDKLARKKDGDIVRIAGLVLVRQRPGTASGVVFVTIEDETAHANLVVWSTIFEQHRRQIMTSNLLACVGKLQREGEVVHVVARELYDLSKWLKDIDGANLQSSPLPSEEMRFISRDFH